MKTYHLRGFFNNLFDRSEKMRFNLVLSCLLLLLFSVDAYGQAWKVAIPAATGISQGHFVYPSPAVPGHTHFGADIHVGQSLCGASIYPLAQGEVMKVTAGYSGGLGNAIMIRYSKLGRNNGDLYTIYLHMESAPNVNGRVLSVGDTVYSGISVGKVGATGFANGTCHTHLEVRNFYYPGAAGGGWYHPNSTRCSDGALNIYACGDQRGASWALNDWENPATFQVPCNPSKERCNIRKGGAIGWYPPVDDCQQATQWFQLIYDNQNQVSRIVPTTKASCPLACFAN